jgi:hypothetical protein
MERRIVRVIGPRPLPVKALASRAGCTACQRFRRALMLLAQAGVVERVRYGWRLVHLAEVVEVVEVAEV